MPQGRKGQGKGKASAAAAARGTAHVGEEAWETEAISLPEDDRCLLCREVLFEPVVLPCDKRHRLCSPCFRQVESKSELSCPFCRKRLSNWIRQNRDSLVDTKLWQSIQEKYPKLVSARRDGVDLGYGSCEPQAPRIIAKSGELHKEYEAERLRLEEELRIKAIQEEEESRPLLEKLVREVATADGRDLAEIERADRELAERLQAEERAAPIDEAIIEADAKFARELQEALNGSSKPDVPQEDRDACAAASAASDPRVERGASKAGLTKRRSGKDDDGSRSKQPSLDAHVHIIGSDDSDEDFKAHDAEGNGMNNTVGSGGARPRMQKCPMCAVAFVMDVLLEHASVCNGPTDPVRHSAPTQELSPGTSGGAGSASTKRKDTIPDASPPTLDDFVVRSGKKHRGPDHESET